MSIKYDIFTPAETITTRIFPELAAEIGLNESIVLLQIAHWIRISKHDIDEQWWAFKSIRDMKADDFSYFSIATINRIIKSLAEQHLIVVRDDLNTRKGDRTRWFALDIEGVSRLRSVVLLHADTTKTEVSAQFETASAQFETVSAQDETTLPDITTDKDKDISPPEKIAASTRIATRGGKRDRPRTRERNPWFDTLMEATGHDPAFETLTAQSFYGKAATELKTAGILPEQIKGLVAYIATRAKRERWSGYSLGAVTRYAGDYLKSLRPSTKDPKILPDGSYDFSEVRTIPAHDEDRWLSPLAAVLS